MIQNEYAAKLPKNFAIGPVAAEIEPLENRKGNLQNLIILPKISKKTWHFVRS